MNLRKKNSNLYIIKHDHFGFGLLILIFTKNGSVKTTYFTYFSDYLVNGIQLL